MQRRAHLFILPPCSGSTGMGGTREIGWPPRTTRALRAILLSTAAGYIKGAQQVEHSTVALPLADAMQAMRAMYTAVQEEMRAIQASGRYSSEVFHEEDYRWKAIDNILSGTMS